VGKMAWTKPPADSIPPKYLWRNGEFIPWEEGTVHIYGIGGIAASGIYEGIRGYWNSEKRQLYLNSLKPHLDRLFDSIKIMRLDISYSKKEVENAIVELVKKNVYKENIYIRPNVFEYRPPFKKDVDAPSTWMTLIAFPRPTGLNEKHTRRVGVSTWLRPTDQISPPRVKSIANTMNGRLAEREVQNAGFDESIQLSIDGKVAEMGEGANLCLIKDEVIITPSNRQSILAGVTKDIVLMMSKKTLNLQTCEREIDRTELYIADEIFTCGTGHAEITPVISVDGININDGEPGKITTKIRELYYDIMLGKKQEYMHLLTPVY
jgi:branched-chain amino acid aminotransferase